MNPLKALITATVTILLVCFVLIYNDTHNDARNDSIIPLTAHEANQKSRINQKNSIINQISYQVERGNNKIILNDLYQENADYLVKSGYTIRYIKFENIEFRQIIITW